MKILMLGTKAQGGMRTVVDSYIRSSINKKYPITYIPTHIESNLLFQSAYFFYSILKCMIYLPNKEYKIVHMHISKEGSIIRKSILAFLCKMFNKKIIFHTHGGEFFEKLKNHGNLIQKLIVKLINAADILIALSNKRKNEYSQIIDGDRIRVVYNCSSMPKEHRKPKKTEYVKIVSVGRLGSVKGTDDLIDAVYMLRREKISVEIWGDGETESAIKKAENLKINNILKIPGWAGEKDKLRIFSEADIFVLPSHFEDLPVAIIEAMSYGLPVVSTYTGGIPELVRPRNNGFLVRPGDTKDLAKKLRILIRNRQLRKRMGEASFRLFKENFEQSVMEKNMLDIYRELERN